MYNSRGLDIKNKDGSNSSNHLDLPWLVITKDSSYFSSPKQKIKIKSFIKKENLNVSDG